jgi:hypothetical protein
MASASKKQITTLFNENTMNLIIPKLSKNLFFQFAHGSLDLGDTIDLNDNERVIMLCKNTALRCYQLEPYQLLFPEIKSTDYSRYFDKIYSEIFLEKCARSPIFTNQNFCVFENKTPNLSISLEHNNKPGESKFDRKGIYKLPLEYVFDSDGKAQFIENTLKPRLGQKKPGKVINIDTTQVAVDDIKKIKPYLTITSPHIEKDEHGFGKDTNLREIIEWIRSQEGGATGFTLVVFSCRASPIKGTIPKRKNTTSTGEWSQALSLSKKKTYAEAARAKNHNPMEHHHNTHNSMEHYNNTHNPMEHHHNTHNSMEHYNNTHNPMEHHHNTHNSNNNNNESNNHMEHYTPNNTNPNNLHSNIVNKFYYGYNQNSRRNNKTKRSSNTSRTRHIKPRKPRTHRNNRNNNNNDY